jgi:hypothetical protein
MILPSLKAKQTKFTNANNLLLLVRFKHRYFLNRLKSQKEVMQDLSFVIARIVSGIYTQFYFISLKDTGTFKEF